MTNQRKGKIINNGNNNGEEKNIPRTYFRVYNKFQYGTCYTMQQLKVAGNNI